MRTFEEYRKAETQRKEATTEAEQKDAIATMNAVCSRLWNEDNTVQYLRIQEQAALRTRNIAALRYMLNEYNSLNKIMHQYHRLPKHTGFT